MSEIKLTKNELRNQEVLIAQLRKYLPTLQLKKAMLQLEVQEAKGEVKLFQASFEEAVRLLEEDASLLTLSVGIDVRDSIKVQEVKKKFENIAGVEVPELEDVVFFPFNYPLFDTPAWVDTLLGKIKSVRVKKEKIKVAEEKQELLEKELREVSIRVNLFEKILIPRCKENIRKIKVFLGDQQLAAISQAKVAKGKLSKG